MKYSMAHPGRIFVIRLEDGEVIHEVIEDFAARQNIRAAGVLALGGADDGSALVVGPLEDRAIPVTPMEYLLKNTHEATGTGTIFPDENGHPILHMHMACGRRTETITGCVRAGVKVWRVMEVIIFELLDTPAVRATEPPTDFKLLQPDGL